MAMIYLNGFNKMKKQVVEMFERFWAMDNPYKGHSYVGDYGPRLRLAYLKCRFMNDISPLEAENLYGKNPKETMNEFWETYDAWAEHQVYHEDIDKDPVLMDLERQFPVPDELKRLMNGVYLEAREKDDLYYNLDDGFGFLGDFNFKKLMNKCLGEQRFKDLILYLKGVIDGGKEQERDLFCNTIKFRWYTDSEQGTTEFRLQKVDPFGEKYTPDNDLVIEIIDLPPEGAHFMYYEHPKKWA